MIDVERISYFDDQTIELFGRHGGTVPEFLGSPTFQGIVAQRRLEQVISSIDSSIKEGGSLKLQFVWARWIIVDGSDRQHCVYTEDPQEDPSVLDRLRCYLKSIEDMNSYPDRHPRIPEHLDRLTLAT